MTNPPGEEDKPPPGYGYGGQPPPQQPSGQPPYGYGPPPGYGAQPPYPPYPPYYPPQADHPRATLAMILGIVAIACCGFSGPFAWAIGAKAVREIDASGGRLGGRGQAMAGKVLGIIGTVLMIFAVLYLVVIIALVAAGSLNDPGPFTDTGV